MKRYKTIVLIAGLLLFGADTFAQNLAWRLMPGRMPFPVAGCKALVKDSLVYVLGGYSDSIHQNINIIQIYNPSTNSWLPHYLRMAGKRSGFIAENFLNGFLICGGIDSSNSNAIGLEFLEPTTGIGSRILQRDPNFSRISSAGKIYGNSLFLFGGNIKGDEGDSSNDLSFLIEVSLLPKPSIVYRSNALFGDQLTYQQMIALVDDDIYLFGGVSNVITRKVYKFDTQNKSFTSDSPSLLSIRAGGEAVYDGKGSIYIIGGYNETQILSSVEVYSPGNGQNSISQGPPLNHARKNFAAVSYKDNIYVFGGFDKFNNTIGTVEKLDYATDVKGGKYSSNIPKDFTLYNNYPNPFNAGTVIKFSLPEKSQVSIDIYTALGEHVAILTRGNSFSAGEHSLHWDGTDKNGRILGSGLYIYRMTAGNFVQSKKMVMVK